MLFHFYDHSPEIASEVICQARERDSKIFYCTTIEKKSTVFIANLVVNFRMPACEIVVSYVTRWKLVPTECQKINSLDFSTCIFVNNNFIFSRIAVVLRQKGEVNIFRLTEYGRTSSYYLGIYV